MILVCVCGESGALYNLWIRYSSAYKPRHIIISKALHFQKKVQVPCSIWQIPQFIYQAQSCAKLMSVYVHVHGTSNSKRFRVSFDSNSGSSFLKIWVEISCWSWSLGAKHSLCLFCSTNFEGRKHQGETRICITTVKFSYKGSFVVVKHRNLC